MGITPKRTKGGQKRRRKELFLIGVLHLKGTVNRKSIEEEWNKPCREKGLTKEGDEGTKVYHEEGEGVRVPIIDRSLGGKGIPPDGQKRKRPLAVT